MLGDAGSLTKVLFHAPCTSFVLALQTHVQHVHTFCLLVPPCKESSFQLQDGAPVSTAGIDQVEQECQSIQLHLNYPQLGCISTFWKPSNSLKLWPCYNGATARSPVRSIPSPAQMGSSLLGPSSAKRFCSPSMCSS